MQTFVWSYKSYIVYRLKIYFHIFSIFLFILLSLSYKKEREKRERERGENFK